MYATSTTCTTTSVLHIQNNLLETVYHVRNSFYRYVKEPGEAVTVLIPRKSKCLVDHVSWRQSRQTKQVAVQQ